MKMNMELKLKEIQGPYKMYRSRYKTDLTRNHILVEANEWISTTHLFTAEATLSDDKCVQFYTDLPNAAILKAVYEFIAPKESSLLSKLTPFQEVMLILGSIHPCRI